MTRRLGRSSAMRGLVSAVDWHSDHQRSRIHRNLDRQLSGDIAIDLVGNFLDRQSRFQPHLAGGRTQGIRVLYMAARRNAEQKRNRRSPANSPSCHDFKIIRERICTRSGVELAPVTPRLSDDRPTDLFFDPRCHHPQSRQRGSCYHFHQGLKRDTDPPPERLERRMQPSQHVRVGTRRNHQQDNFSPVGSSHSHLLVAARKQRLDRPGGGPWYLELIREHRGRTTREHTHRGSTPQQPPRHRVIGAVPAVRENQRHSLSSGPSGKFGGMFRAFRQLVLELRPETSRPRREPFSTPQ